MITYNLTDPAVKQIGSEGKSEQFQGKRCLITGASSGIGYGLAERLLQRGAEVWICSRDPQRMKAAADKLIAAYGRVHWTTLNVSDAQALKAFADEMAAAGPIDYLFANAGVSNIAAFDECPIDYFRFTMETNFFGVINTDMAVLPHMLRQGFGTVVNVSSMEGFTPNGYHTPYVSSKYAVLGLTESLRLEYADRNIRFETVCPGPVMSNIWGKGMDGVVYEGFKAPENALTELQSADEILAGIEEQRPIILVTDTARLYWKALHEDPEQGEALISGYTQYNKQVHDFAAARAREREARAREAR